MLRAVGLGGQQKRTGDNPDIGDNAMISTGVYLLTKSTALTNAERHIAEKYPW